MRKLMFWVVALWLTAATVMGCCANKPGHSKGDACCAPGADKSKTSTSGSSGY